MAQTDFYKVFSEYNARSEGDTKVIKSNNPNRPDLTYLSWASAWQQVLKVDPLATYEVKPTNDGNLIHKVGKGAMVIVQVCILGHTKEEYYPIESMAMKSIDFENITPTAVNKSIKRALTKCIALFGLGLNLYLNEELTEAEMDSIEDDITKKVLSCNTIDELNATYTTQKDIISSTPKLLRMFTARKQELLTKTKK